MVLILNLLTSVFNEIKNIRGCKIFMLKNCFQKMRDSLREKCPNKYGVFYGPYFPVIGFNTDIYSVNLRI